MNEKFNKNTKAEKFTTMLTYQIYGVTVILSAAACF